MESMTRDTALFIPKMSMSRTDPRLGGWRRQTNPFASLIVDYRENDDERKDVGHRTL